MGNEANPVTADMTGTNKTYTVESGDSLWKISRKLYGRGENWDKIYQANKDSIRDPKLLHVGQIILIPD